MLWNKIGSSNFNYHPPACLHVLSVWVGEKEGTFSDRSITTKNAAIHCLQLGEPWAPNGRGPTPRTPGWLHLRLAVLLMDINVSLQPYSEKIFSKFNSFVKHAHVIRFTKQKSPREHSKKNWQSAKSPMKQLNIDSTILKKISACLQFVAPQVPNVKQLIFKRENTAFTPNNHGSFVQTENSYKCIS